MRDLSSDLSEALITAPKKYHLVEDRDWGFRVSSVSEEYDKSHMVCVMLPPFHKMSPIRSLFPSQFVKS